MSAENWQQYVRRVTRNMTQSRIADLTGAAQTNIGRWLRGETPAPKAESVVAFARALGHEPLEALIAAGYLTPEEAGATVKVSPSLAGITTRQLLDELDRRIVSGDGGIHAE